MLKFARKRDVCVCVAKLRVKELCAEVCVCERVVCVCVKALCVWKFVC